MGAEIRDVRGAEVSGYSGVVCVKKMDVLEES